MPQSHLRYSVRGVDRKEPARDMKSEGYQLQQSQYQLSFVPPDYVSTTGGIQLDSKTISHANRFVSGSVPQYGWAISYDESSDIFRGSVQLPQCIIPGISRVPFEFHATLGQAPRGHLFLQISNCTILLKSKNFQYASSVDMMLNMAPCLCITGHKLKDCNTG